MSLKKNMKIQDKFDKHIKEDKFFQAITRKISFDHLSKVKKTYTDKIQRISKISKLNLI